MSTTDPPRARDQVVTAAVVFAVGIVLASALLVGGAFVVADRVMDRFDASVERHGGRVQDAGAAVGRGLHDGFARAESAIGEHARSIIKSGELIRSPTILMKSPIEIQQPVTIQGPREDGALPVNGRIAK